jgi:tetratricopeptide (TPR) repeat protein
VRFRPLEHPDSLHFQSAIGWLELGNHLEANEELEQIRPQWRAHPDVLALRWQIYRKAGKYEVCLDLSTTLYQVNPRELTWVVLHAQSHYHLKRYQEAYDLLVQAVASNPHNWSAHYDLACYACLLGRLEEAQKLLHRAMELGDENLVRTIALDDPDLERFWSSM